MTSVAFVVGVALVVAAASDLLNTLIATKTVGGRWWLTNLLYRYSWIFMRVLVSRIRSERVREALLQIYPPMSVIMLLNAWVAQQIVGYGLIWWSVSDIEGIGGLGDAMYYSGVVFFTVGFGEIVPAGAVPRVGTLLEAFSGVLTMALVIGYLPALYGAFSQREKKLMTLDDGTEDRLTPTNLLLSRAPAGDVDEILRFFEGWEEWVAEVLGTHTTFPMLAKFRSNHIGQNWVTALGLLADSALQCQIIVGARNRAPYWMLRRIIVLFDDLTRGTDLSEYRNRLDLNYGLDSEQARVSGGESDELFAQMYNELGTKFELIPYDQARDETLELRRKYDAQLEYLIDFLMAPRGFWGHAIGCKLTDGPFGSVSIRE